MSGALWCDAKDHPFSANDPNRETFERRRKDKNGNVQKVTVDVCGPHMAVMPGFETLPAQIEGSEPLTPETQVE